MDGATFANALVALDATPAEMSWKLGVDVLSFGATKNGAMTADAIVSFDPARRPSSPTVTSAAGRPTSKTRFQTAQLDAYLSDDLWLNNALHANHMAARLRQGLATAPGVSVLGDATANTLFCRFPTLETHSTRPGSTSTTTAGNPA